MHRHAPTQRDLLLADIDRLRDERCAALTREAEARDAQHRAEEMTHAAAAQAQNAATTAEVLGFQIDCQLEALYELPEQR